MAEPQISFLKVMKRPWLIVLLGTKLGVIYGALDVSYETKSLRSIKQYNDKLDTRINPVKFVGIVIHWTGHDEGCGWMDAWSLFGLSEPLERLSKTGAPLEVLEATVDFEHFRGWLVEGLGYGDGARGGRPPFDPVSMFKAPILQAQHNLSDARMEFMSRDRLSWMRFLRFDLGGPTPDENTIRLFRNKLTETGTLKRVMKAFDWQLQKKGYIPMSGQIVDASLVPAPKQRNTDAEKEAIKAGKTAREIWPDEPNKAAQKDTDARWTLKIGGKIRYRPDGTPLPQIALPVFDYKSHIAIDRKRSAEALVRVRGRQAGCWSAWTQGMRLSMREFCQPLTRRVSVWAR